MIAPLRVAVVGAGPSGLYATGHLLEAPGGTYLDGRLQKLVDRPVEVDVFDRLSTQWGLVRHGVAPDHPEKKLVQRVFEETAARPGFRFFGRVEVGIHVSVEELRRWYDAVIFAFGAPGDSQLDIPGEALPGSIAARSFVAWYNGHPDAADLAPDLSHERAVIVGNGNVAMDVARILTLPVDELEKTDIAPAALTALASSRIREVVVLGRRGPDHGAFNNPELEELGRLPGVDVLVEGEVPEPAGQGEATRRKLATLRTYAERPLAGHDKRIVLRFLGSPHEVLGTDRVTGLRIVHNRIDEGRVVPTEKITDLDTGLVLRSIGYFGTPLAGLPFDHDRGVVPNLDGRILVNGTPVPGLYVTGWAKRGPRGIIGTNKVCSRDTVRALLSDDLGARALPAAQVEAILRQRSADLVDHQTWLRLDAAERRAGRKLGRPRLKLVV
ncbi:FAD-dependent oxidoreductase [Nocardia sp. NPDC005825]|uniref:FAD-dependent oxidoreductase n=1 Tax=unclassified Nocardia TaxID=2637762 RepID=UPI0033DA049F